MITLLLASYKHLCRLIMESTLSFRCCVCLFVSPVIFRTQKSSFKRMSLNNQYEVPLFLTRREVNTNSTSLSQPHNRFWQHCLETVACSKVISIDVSFKITKERAMFFNINRCKQDGNYSKEVARFSGEKNLLIAM